MQVDATSAPSQPRPARPAAGSPRRRGVLGALAAGSALVLVLAAFGTHVFLAHRTRVRVCANVAYAWDAPACVGELPEPGRLNHSYVAWRVTSKGDQIIEAETIRPTGDRVQLWHGAAIWRWTYATDGRPEQVELLDRLGHRRYLLRYSADHKLVQIQGAGGQPRSADGVLYVKIARDFDTEGRLVAERFLSASDAPTTDENGVFGYKYKNDRQGLKIEQTALAADGTAISTSDGWSSERLGKDARGDEVESALFGVDGQPVYSSGNEWSSIKIERDSYGSVVKQTFRDANGAPAPDSRGVTSVATQASEDRTSIRRVYLDAQGAPTGDASGVFAIAERYDAHGQITESAALDGQGRPTTFANGASVDVWKYNDLGQIVEWGFLDPDKHPVRIDDGYASERVQYDADGNMTETSYFDESNGPTYGPRGCAKTTRKYGPDRDLVEETCLDIRGAIAPDSDGHSITRLSRDPVGNIVDVRYLSADRTPAIDGNWIAGFKVSLDARYYAETKTFLGLDGQPARTKSGIAQDSYTRDSSLNVILTSHKDAYGHATASSSSASAERARFNAARQAVEQTYLDDAGNPVDRGQGWATLRTGYDERFRPNLFQYFNAAGAAAPNDDGATEIRTKFDAKGRAAESTFTTPAGEGKRGYTTRKMQYDEHGRLLSEAYYDRNGAPVLTKSSGASVRTLRDERGRVVEYAYFDTTGQPYAIEDGYSVVRLRYDNNGRISERAYLDVHGTPVQLGSGKFSSQTFVYDEHGRVTLIACLSSSRQTIPCDPTYASKTRQYDLRGNLTEERKIGMDGQPVSDASGLAGERWRYDDRGLVVEHGYLDKDGKPAAKFLLLKTTYDDRGKPTRMDYVDAKGVPGTSAHGFASVRKGYDALGRVNAIAYFDAKDKPTTSTDCGCARMTLTYSGTAGAYDEQDFDTSDRPLKTKHVDAAR